MDRRCCNMAMDAQIDWPHVLTLLSKVPRRYIAIICLGFFALITVLMFRPSLPSLPTVPSITLSYPSSPYNSSLLALLIENRPVPQLAPLMLHMIGVVPPEWTFQFMGSETSVRFINESKAIQHQVEIGKLRLTYIPENLTTNGQEEINQFFTTLWVYEELMKPAEWVLVFQTDSILCANAELSLTPWLSYDWVGAPWSPASRFGGNGGLSIRHIPTIVSILRQQTRIPGTDPEDVWLSSRIGHRKHASVANGSESVKFSGENIWSEDPMPMGYHTGSSGHLLPGGVWGQEVQRKKIWQYCPEIKMALDLELATVIGESCHPDW